MKSAAVSARSRALYKTPFSRVYWAQAASEFKDLRMLLFAALMIALRVALKPVNIAIAADLRINVAFFVNAFGAMVFGPVVAIPAAAISDTLGYLLYPEGPYFFVPAGHAVPVLHLLLRQHRAEYPHHVAVLQHDDGQELRAVRSAADREKPGDVPH